MYKNIYFLGIGGIGMSAIARFFLLQGAKISGYDRTPSSLTDELISEGIDIHFEENIANIPVDTDLVIYTPAIPKDHKEYLFFLEKNIPMKKRSEMLGMITGDAYTIAVAGTNENTTVTTLIAHILKSAGVPSTAFLGGISKNYGTNFLPNKNKESKNIVVVEADEFDRSFLTLHPDLAVITSMDEDHLDIYGDRESLKKSFMDFSSQIKKDGHLVVKENLRFPAVNINGYTIHTYGMESSAEFHPENLIIQDGQYVFDLVMNGRKWISTITPGLPGLFNIENAVAAAAIAHAAGIPADKIRQAIESYQGVIRRFDYQIRRDDFVYIDDYAHHPAELTACIGAVKKLYPGKKITGVFQPHLFSRTRDFADDFARALELLDRIILLEIYPAREKPIPGITSSMLLEKIKSSDKYLCEKNELISLLMKEKTDVLLTMGAGDIDRLVQPIRDAFNTIKQ
ncbi:MAG: UDP-N-acetylmuramate--L-alanine ligase [Syntrophothermus sp.]